MKRVKQFWDYVDKSGECWLWTVTRGENVRRGLVPQMMTAKHSAVSNCPKGHPYAGENLYIEHPKDGHPRKRCRECRRESHRKVPSRVP